MVTGSVKEYPILPLTLFAIDPFHRTTIIVHNPVFISSLICLFSKIPIYQWRVYVQLEAKQENRKCVTAV